MNPKTFLDGRFWLAFVVYGVIVIPLGGIFVGLNIYWKFWEYPLWESAGIVAFAMILVYICVKGMPEAMSFLTLYPDKIVWRFAPFRKVSISVRECRLVSVAYENRFVESRAWVPEDVMKPFSIRICLSTEPIPEKYKNQITSLRCKKGFIQFVYSDQLASALIELLPNERTAQLKEIYDRMQTDRSSPQIGL